MEGLESQITDNFKLSYLESHSDQDSTMVFSKKAD